MTTALPWLFDSDDFPSVIDALDEPNGLLAAGGSVTTTRLIQAYRQGIFPWSMPGEPVLWWSPEPRGVIYPSEFTPKRSLRQAARQQPWHWSVNRDFSAVINACALLRAEEGTWIDNDIIAGYEAMHRMGYAHSVEVWLGSDLVGGLYGVSLGRLFCGESMFSRQSNASKLAFWALMQLMHRWGVPLVDCQMLNPHLLSLGAEALPRARYLEHVSTVVYQPDLPWAEAHALLSELGFRVDAMHHG